MPQTSSQDVLVILLAGFGCLILLLLPFILLALAIGMLLNPKTPSAVIRPFQRTNTQDSTGSSSSGRDTIVMVFITFIAFGLVGPGSLLIPLLFYLFKLQQPSNSRNQLDPARSRLPVEILAVFDYIIKSREGGASDAQIAYRLKLRGWTEQDIEKAFQLVSERSNLG